MKKLNKILSALGVCPVKVSAMARSWEDDPLQKFNFAMDVTGLGKIGFQSIGGLSSEIGVATYQEAGYKTEHKLKGRQTGGQLTCKRGVYADTSLATAFRNALTNRNNREDLTIYLKDRDGNVQKTWVAHECWASKWEADDLDATSDDVMIETLTIEYEYLEEI